MVWHWIHICIALVSSIYSSFMWEAKYGRRRENTIPRVIALQMSTTSNERLDDIEEK